MTNAKKAPSTHRQKIHPISHTVGDFYRACFSFPNVCDVYWSMHHPKQTNERKGGKRKS